MTLYVAAVVLDASLSFLCSPLCMPDYDLHSIPKWVCFPLFQGHLEVGGVSLVSTEMSPKEKCWPRSQLLSDGTTTSPDLRKPTEGHHCSQHYVVLCTVTFSFLSICLKMAGVIGSLVFLGSPACSLVTRLFPRKTGGGESLGTSTVKAVDFRRLGLAVPIGLQNEIMCSRDLF